MVKEAALNMAMHVAVCGTKTLPVLLPELPSPRLRPAYRFPTQHRRLLPRKASPDSHHPPLCSKPECVPVKMAQRRNTVGRYLRYRSNHPAGQCTKDGTRKVRRISMILLRETVVKMIERHAPLLCGSKTEGSARSRSRVPATRRRTCHQTSLRLGR